MLSLTGIAGTVHQSGCDVVRCVDGSALSSKVAKALSTFETKCVRSSLVALSLGLLEGDRVFLRTVFECGYTGQLIFSTRDATLLECAAGSTQLRGPLLAASISEGYIYASSNGAVSRTRFPHTLPAAVVPRPATPGLSLPCRSGGVRQRSGSLSVLNSPLSLPSPRFQLGASITSLPVLRNASFSGSSVPSAPQSVAELSGDASMLLPGIIYCVALLSGEPGTAGAGTNRLRIVRRDEEKKKSAEPHRDVHLAAHCTMVHALQWDGDHNVDSTFKALASHESFPQTLSLLTVTVGGEVSGQTSFEIPGDFSAGAASRDAVLWFTACLNGHLQVHQTGKRSVRRKTDASRAGALIKVTSLFCFVAHASGATLSIYDHGLNPIKVFIQGVSEGHSVSLGSLSIFPAQSPITVMEYDEGSNTLGVGVSGGPVALLRLCGTVTHSSLLHSIIKGGLEQVGRRSVHRVVEMTESAVALIKNSPRHLWVGMLRQLMTRLVSEVQTPTEVGVPPDGTVSYVEATKQAVHHAVEDILFKFDGSFNSDMQTFSGLFLRYFTILLNTDELMRALKLASLLDRQDWSTLLFERLSDAGRVSLAQVALSYTSSDTQLNATELSTLAGIPLRSEYSLAALEDFLARLEEDTYTPDIAECRVMCRLEALRGNGVPAGHALAQRLAERAHRLGLRNSEDLETLKETEAEVTEGLFLR